MADRCTYNLGAHRSRTCRVGMRLLPKHLMQLGGSHLRSSHRGQVSTASGRSSQCVRTVAQQRWKTTYCMYVRIKLVTSLVEVVFLGGCTRCQSCWWNGGRRLAALSFHSHHLTRVVREQPRTPTPTEKCGPAPPVCRLSRRWSPAWNHDRRTQTPRILKPAAGRPGLIGCQPEDCL